MVNLINLKQIASLLTLSSILATTNAIFLDTNNDTNINEVTALIAKGLMDYYEGYKYGGTIGMFTWPYYWWEAGGAWGALLHYTYYTGDQTYVPTIMEALLYQTGDHNNYIPLNQSTTEGNDDQGFWGLAVMSAAEMNFTNPQDPDKAWLTLTQAVFNTMAARWDSSCNGGLRWQIFQWNSGYSYKNSVSNGCFFQIGARLARYTGNTSYVDWAEKIWEWMEEADLIYEYPGNEYWFIYDGVDADDCSNITKYQWTYNQGLFLAGCAFLWNFTQEEIWRNRTLHLLKGVEVFVADVYNGSKVLYEAACQPLNSSITPRCSQDQRSFKGYLSRFLGYTSLMLPETADFIRPIIVDSANAAAGSCSGGTDGHTCGLAWTAGGWDGFYGLGEQMTALEVMTTLKVHEKKAPYTSTTGGSSLGNPAAGFDQGNYDTSPLSLTSADKVGAGIITAIISLSVIGCGVWLML